MENNNNEVFRTIIPYTVNINGKEQNMQKQLMKFVLSEKTREVSRMNWVSIEDRNMLAGRVKDLMSMLTVDPRYVLCIGRFGDFKDEGVEFICTKVSTDKSIDLNSLRFDYLLVTNTKYGIDKVEIIDAHITAVTEEIRDL